MTNPLRYVKQLEGVGLSREQAETHVQIIMDFVEGELATKQDLTNVKTGIEQKILDLKTEIKLEISDLNHRLIEMESRLTIKMGAMMTVIAGLIVGSIKLL